MKRTVTISSKEIVKAKSAPDSIPGTMEGRITRRTACAFEAPRLRAACSVRGSTLASAAETVMTT
jgi:hypothetical protein